MINIKAIREAAKKLQTVDGFAEPEKFDYLFHQYGIETRPEVMLAMCDEIERLSACLKKANDQAEHFEREWYLRGDEIERLRKDAARYQLLKRKYTTENDHGELRIEFECGFDHYNDIDAAIDRAMEAKT